jgi:hypothetical protein
VFLLLLLPLLSAQLHAMLPLSRCTVATAQLHWLLLQRTEILLVEPHLQACEGHVRL